MSDIQVVYTIDIQRHVPCYRPCSFYSGAGELDKRALQKLLAGHEKNVIGWYKFRQNTDQTMTFRERILHQNLQAYLSNSELVFLEVTTQSTTETESTHLIEYSLHKSQDGLFQKVPLIIANLGMLEQQGYSTLSGACVSVGFNQAVKNHRLEFFNEDGTLKEVNKITGMCKSLQEQLKDTCSRVVESENSVEQLIQQVNQLKMQIAEKRKLRSDGEKKPANPEENVFLCKAMRHFFPGSAHLQSCHLSLTGEPVPHNCDDNHTLSEVNKLTLMIQQCDLPEAGTRKAGKRKRPPLKNKSNLLLMKTRAATQQSNSSDRVLFTSGTETEEDSERLQMDYTGSQSPTF
ncbi:BRCA1-A complex subunit Abraxas 1 isoform X2 [Pseudophryne corroboree]